MACGGVWWCVVACGGVTSPPYQHDLTHLSRAITEVHFANLKVGSKPLPRLPATELAMETTLPDWPCDGREPGATWEKCEAMLTDHNEGLR